MIGILLVVVPMVQAKGTAGVENTVHNLSAQVYGAPNTLSPYASDESEICIFCHTPHGGALEDPLWNRSFVDQTATYDLKSAGYFKHYNSTTLSSTVFGGQSSRALNAESLICMSCHDGTIAVNRVLNPNNANGQPKIAGADELMYDRKFGQYYEAQIGSIPGNVNAYGDLSDDHPISFSYAAAALADTGLNSSATLWSDQLLKAEQPYFFGGQTEMRVECPTCHDPHVDYRTDTAYDPFLIMPNAGSAMCLACHNK